jgi:hypothetical protein
MTDLRKASREMMVEIGGFAAAVQVHNSEKRCPKEMPKKRREGPEKALPYLVVFAARSG